MKNIKAFITEIEEEDGINLIEYDIKELYSHISKTNIFWSWGTTMRQNYFDTHLMLKVNGFLWKEWVSISLNSNDTFVVCKVKASGEIVEIWEEVYIDELLQTIDSFVEKNTKESEKEYNEKSNKFMGEVLTGS